MERYDRGIHIADFHTSEMLLKHVDGTNLNHLRCLSKGFHGELIFFSPLSEISYSLICLFT